MSLICEPCLRRAKECLLVAVYDVKEKDERESVSTRLATCSAEGGGLGGTAWSEWRTGTGCNRRSTGRKTPAGSSSPSHLKQKHACK